MENNNMNRQAALNSLMRGFKGIVLANDDLSCLHMLSFDGYRWFDDFAMFFEIECFGGYYEQGNEDTKADLDWYIKPNKLYKRIKLLHELGYKQVTLKSGPTAVTGPTEVISQKLYEISFWRNDDFGDDRYECTDIIAINEDKAIEMLRSDLKDEFGYANFVVDEIKLLYDANNF